jgi:hypothetical protein
VDVWERQFHLPILRHHQAAFLDHARVGTFGDSTESVIVFDLVTISCNVLLVKSGTSLNAVV